MSAVQESLSSDKDKPVIGKTGNSKATAKREPPTLWQRATFRWTAITAVMAVLLVVYTQHPYYKNQGQFEPWRSYYPLAFVVWLLLGLFYIKATLEKFQGMRYTVRDGGLHLLILGRALLRKNGNAEELSRKLGSSVRSAIFAGVGVWAACLIGRFIGVTTFSPENTIGVAAGMKGPIPTFIVGAVIMLGVFAVLGLLYHWLAEHARYGRFWKTVKNRRLRTTCMGIFVKAFFTPLMLGFFSGHARTISDLWFKHKHLTPFKIPALTGNPFERAATWASYLAHRIPEALPSGADFTGFFNFFAWTRSDISWGLDVAYNFVFFVDCGTALIGYSLESRWLGNKTRSVEPTFLGWSCALACYPPFNNVLGTYLPLDNGPSIINSEDMHLAFRAATVVLFTIYASATVAFGFKFSNLTNRGIISRGPYKYIRHPAYVTKCSAWWLEHLPTMTFTKAIFLTGLCSVYALRAWTEERHLSRDPEYAAYKKKVPWVILPGVF